MTDSVLEWLPNLPAKSKARKCGYLKSSCKRFDQQPNQRQTEYEARGTIIHSVCLSVLSVRTLQDLAGAVAGMFGRLDDTHDSCKARDNQSDRVLYACQIAFMTVVRLHWFM
jgi:hypothetical protein